MFIAKHTLPSVDRASSLFKLYSVEASLSVLYKYIEIKFKSKDSKIKSVFKVNLVVNLLTIQSPEHRNNSTCNENESSRMNFCIEIIQKKSYEDYE